MEAIRTLAILLPLGLSSGLNLYATVLVAGLSIRFGLVQNPPAGLEALAAWPVILLAALFYALEFFADKVQFVDNLWDLLHTFIRPLGAAILALAALGKTDPVLIVLAVLFSGSLALVSHTSKAATRVALNVASPLENISNIGLSLGEDAAAAGLTFLALKYPLVAGLLSLLLLVLFILVVPRVLRWTWFLLQALAGWAARLSGRAAAVDALPLDHAALLHALPGGLPAGQPPELAARCKAQNIRGANGRTGYLVLAGSRCYFTYDARAIGGRPAARAWQIDRSQVVSQRLTQRVLFDVLTVRYRDAAGKERSARFAFLKDRAGAAEQAAMRLAGLAGVGGAGAGSGAAGAGLPASVP